MAALSVTVAISGPQAALSDRMTAMAALGSPMVEMAEPFVGWRLPGSCLEPGKWPEPIFHCVKIRSCAAYSAPAWPCGGLLPGSAPALPAGPWLSPRQPRLDLR